MRRQGRKSATAGPSARCLICILVALAGLPLCLIVLFANRGHGRRSWAQQWMQRPVQPVTRESWSSRLAGRDWRCRHTQGRDRVVDDQGATPLVSKLSVWFLTVVAIRRAPRCSHCAAFVCAGAVCARANISVQSGCCDVQRSHHRGWCGECRGQDSCCQSSEGCISCCMGVRVCARVAFGGLRLRRYSLTSCAYVLSVLNECMGYSPLESTSHGPKGEVQAWVDTSTGHGGQSHNSATPWRRPQRKCHNHTI